MNVCKEEFPAKSQILNILHCFKIGSVKLMFPKTGFRLQPSRAIRNKALFILRITKIFILSANKTQELPLVSKSQGFFYSAQETLKCRLRFDIFQVKYENSKN